MPPIKRYFIILCLLLLTGCVQPFVIEDLQLSQIQGYDDTEEEKQLKATVAAPIYGSREQTSGVQDVFYSAKAKTNQDIQTKLQAESPFPFEIGKLSGLLFSKEFATENSIFRVIDSLTRDPNVGRRIYMGVVDGKAEQLIKNSYTKEQTLNRYLTNLIKHNIEKNLPTSNLHEFMYSYYGRGMDPFLPLLKQESQVIRITGLALFKGDRYIDNIPQDDLVLFKLLYEPTENATFDHYWKEQDVHLSIRSASSNVDYQVQDDGSISITLKVKGIIEDLPGLSVTRINRLGSVEKEVTKKIEKEGKAMIQSFQEKGIDPLRIGDRVRSQTRNWKEEKWKDAYPNKEININVDLNISEAGIKD